MYKKIMVAVDGSDVSHRSLERAAKLAVAEKAELVILHAIHQHFLTDDELDYAQKCCGEKFSRIVAGSFLPKSPIDDDKSSIDSFQNYIDAQKKFFNIYGTEILNNAQSRATELGIENIKLIHKEGEPAKVILEAAKSEKVDLIVVGRHGHNPIVEFFLGSTAKTIVQYADRSVLTVD